MPKIDLNVSRASSNLNVSRVFGVSFERYFAELKPLASTVYSGFSDDVLRSRIRELFKHEIPVDDVRENLNKEIEKTRQNGDAFSQFMLSVRPKQFKFFTSKATPSQPAVSSSRLNESFRFEDEDQEESAALALPEFRVPTAKNIPAIKQAAASKPSAAVGMAMKPIVSVPQAKADAKEVGKQVNVAGSAKSPIFAAPVGVPPRKKQNAILPAPASILDAKLVQSKNTESNERKIQGGNPGEAMQNSQIKQHPPKLRDDPRGRSTGEDAAPPKQPKGKPDPEENRKLIQQKAYPIRSKISNESPTLLDVIQSTIAAGKSREREPPDRRGNALGLSTVNAPPKQPHGKPDPNDSKLTQQKASPIRSTIRGEPSRDPRIAQSKTDARKSSERRQVDQSSGAIGLEDFTASTPRTRSARMREEQAKIAARLSDEIIDPVRGRSMVEQDAASPKQPQDKPDPKDCKLGQKASPIRSKGNDEPPIFQDVIQSAAEARKSSERELPDRHGNARGQSTVKDAADKQPQGKPDPKNNKLMQQKASPIRSKINDEPSLIPRVVQLTTEARKSSERRQVDQPSRVIGPEDFTPSPPRTRSAQKREALAKIEARLNDEIIDLISSDESEPVVLRASLSKRKSDRKRRASSEGSANPVSPKKPLESFKQSQAPLATPNPELVSPSTKRPKLPPKLCSPAASANGVGDIDFFVLTPPEKSENSAIPAPIRKVPVAKLNLSPAEKRNDGLEESVVKRVLRSSGGGGAKRGIDLATLNSRALAGPFETPENRYRLPSNPEDFFRYKPVMTPGSVQQSSGRVSESDDAGGEIEADSEEEEMDESECGEEIEDEENSIEEIEADSDEENETGSGDDIEAEEQHPNRGELDRSEVFDDSDLVVEHEQEEDESPPNAGFLTNESQLSDGGEELDTSENGVGVDHDDGKQLENDSADAFNMSFESDAGKAPQAELARDPSPVSSSAELPNVAAPPMPHGSKARWLPEDADLTLLFDSASSASLLQSSSDSAPSADNRSAIDDRSIDLEPAPSAETAAGESSSGAEHRSIDSSSQEDPFMGFDGDDEADPFMGFDGDDEEDSLSPAF